MQAYGRRQSIAIACRVLYGEGQCRGLAGQLSVRRPSGAYITQALGVWFNETSVFNLLVLNSDLEVLQGEGVPNPANRFHSWIYQQKPAVGCIIHMHSPSVSALSMTHERIEIAHMDTCCLYDEIAYLSEWPGIPIGNDEGELICHSLLDKKALVMVITAI